MTPLYRRSGKSPVAFGASHSPHSLSGEASRDWRVILDQVREVRLENGLIVLSLPRKGIGAVVCDLYYAGGSAADPPGMSGLTHFLEHMVFNGTKNVPRGAIDRFMLRIAGQHNAETGADFCRFWSHVPRGAFELALALEADRMQGAILETGDFLRERQVILEEEARYRELPFEELMTRLMATIFADHPYAHPAIGTPGDLFRIRIEDLHRHYRRIFNPSNALLVIAGDVTPRDALALAAKRFSNIRPDSAESLPALPEPASTAFDGRLIEIESNELVPRGAMLWPAPGPFDLASRAWGVTISILGGGRSSRLWQALVDDRQIAAHVSVSLSDERLGGYLMIELELHPGQNPKTAESVVHEAVEKLAAEGPTPEEMARVTASRSSAGCWARQQTQLLATAIGTWRLFSDLDSLREAWRLDDKVTPEQVARIAAGLTPNRCIRGWTLPASMDRHEKGDIEKPAAQKPAPFDDPKPETARPIAARYERLAEKAAGTPLRVGRRASPRIQRLGSGAVLLSEPARNQGICALELRWRTGWLEESVPGLACLTARVCEESPVSKGGKSLAETFEALGASIDSGPSGFTVQGRANDLEEILGHLLSSVSTFSPAASLVKRTARKIRTELEADSDDPAFLAEQMLRELAFEGLPGSTDFRGTRESLKTVRIADVKAHAASWYRPENMMLGVAGDFRPDHELRKLERSILASFGRARNISIPDSISPAVFDRPLPPGRIRVMRSPGSQTHIVMGHRTVARTHPDWLALQILEIVIGAGPGLTDLLSQRLREELGLIYGVSMAMTEGAWTTPGHMRISFSCDPADAGKAEAETLGILAEVSQGRLSDEDCLQARDHFRNSWFLGFESADDRLSSRLDTELDGWDLELPPRWSRRCSELTAEEIRQAARRHIRPQFLQIVRYGP